MKLRHLHVGSDCLPLGFPLQWEISQLRLLPSSIYINQKRVWISEAPSQGLATSVSFWGADHSFRLTFSHLCRLCFIYRFWESLFPRLVPLHKHCHNSTSQVDALKMSFTATVITMYRPVLFCGVTDGIIFTLKPATPTVGVVPYRRGSTLRHAAIQTPSTPDTYRPR